MIFIQTNQNNLVNYMHHMPFDPVNGLGKTKEELKKEGYLVNDIPDALQIKGKYEIMYYSKEKGIYYEYEDIPKTQEELQQEVNAKLLKDSANMQIELNKQRELNADLLIKIAKLGGNVSV